MTKILEHFENIKLKYAEILKQELATFDENVEVKMQTLRENIYKKREKYSCGKCASCCKLAATPYTFEELNKMAESGDNYASQFVSVFVPYDDEDMIKSLYPDYFETLKLTGEKINFYHCKFLKDDSNLCPRYEDRPQICKDFPDNPIDILPKACSYNSWHEDVEDDILRLRALTELVNLEKENN